MTDDTTKSALARSDKFEQVDGATPVPHGYCRIQVGETFPLKGAWFVVRSIGKQTVTLEITGPTGKHKRKKRKR